MPNYRLTLDIDAQGFLRTLDAVDARIGQIEQRLQKLKAAGKGASDPFVQQSLSEYAMLQGGRSNAKALQDSASLVGQSLSAGQLRQALMAGGAAAAQAYAPDPGAASSITRMMQAAGRVGQAAGGAVAARPSLQSVVNGVLASAQVDPSGSAKAPSNLPGWLNAAVGGTRAGNVLEYAAGNPAVRAAITNYGPAAAVAAAAVTAFDRWGRSDLLPAAHAYTAYQQAFGAMDARQAAGGFIDATEAGSYYRAATARANIARFRGEIEANAWWAHARWNPMNWGGTNEYDEQKKLADMERRATQIEAEGPGKSAQRRLLNMTGWAYRGPIDMPAERERFARAALPLGPSAARESAYDPDLKFREMRWGTELTAAGAGTLTRLALDPRNVEFRKLMMGGASVEKLGAAALPLLAAAGDLEGIANVLPQTSEQANALARSTAARVFAFQGRALDAQTDLGAAQSRLRLQQLQGVKPTDLNAADVKGALHELVANLQDAADTIGKTAGKGSFLYKEAAARVAAARAQEAELGASMAGQQLQQYEAEAGTRMANIGVTAAKNAAYGTNPAEFYRIGKATVGELEREQADLKRELASGKLPYLDAEKLRGRLKELEARKTEAMSAASAGAYNRAASMAAPGLAEGQEALAMAEMFGGASDVRSASARQQEDLASRVKALMASAADERNNIDARNQARVEASGFRVQAAKSALEVRAQAYDKEDTIGYSLQTARTGAARQILNALPYAPRNRMALELSSIAAGRDRIQQLQARMAETRAAGQLSPEQEGSYQQQIAGVQAQIAQSLGAFTEGGADRLPAMSAGRPAFFSRISATGLLALQYRDAGLPTRSAGAVGGGHLRAQDQFVRQFVDPNVLLPYSRTQALNNGGPAGGSNVQRLLQELVNLVRQAGGGVPSRARPGEALGAMGGALDRATSGAAPYRKQRFN